jgi:hypothetical protein
VTELGLSKASSKGIEVHHLIGVFERGVSPSFITLPLSFEGEGD